MASTDPDADAWAGERVARWIRQSAVLERQMAPVSTRLFAAAALQAGEAVLDAGPTTREAARAVGASGRVTGLDVAAEMLNAAARTAPDAGAAPIDWVVADAAIWDAPAGEYDVVISRFGMMFFAEPMAAMTRLATATRPGGRLAVAVWGHRDTSPLFEVPYRAAVNACEAAGHPVEPVPADAGPFAWHDDAYVTRLLASSGWRDPAIVEHTLALPFAGGLDPQAAADSAVDFGPTRLVLANAPADVTAAARNAIAAALAEHVDDNGAVVLDAAVRIVTARR